MGFRGLAALVVLLATGIVGGYAGAAWLRPDPVTNGAPAPVVAADPSVPGDIEAPVAPDPDDEPMAVDLETRPFTLGEGRASVTFPAPAGWTKLQPFTNLVKFRKPGTSDNTYVLRVTQVGAQGDTVRDLIAEQNRKVKESYEDPNITTYTYDTLTYDYVFDNHRRYAITTWMDLTGSGVGEVEITVTGREVDLPGMEALMTQIVNGMEPS